MDKLKNIVENCIGPEVQRKPTKLQHYDRIFPGDDPFLNQLKTSTHYHVNILYMQREFIYIDR